ncbi:TDP-N-acetylfucosamine:lipid II N-acetylfucosaminyltransferase [Myroides sp. WP-1]|uniref:TDP-N-acetylfucosamine:lipid II N-acetylfucosaminyltransferase n=1 Tax=Myroides sp. WP-1 TaxID=2759944 RepID=UPI0015FAB076|nr:TDP-N-acetylfucosamine:lipid II N-acetylfucosaminyltransferase [Myroides sp. WP-1]MBB1140537.1 TDP-N-acetylfucosamine:lipid II N-acetylfucosaminyltransferase [Myroides sp. WP-1]
MAKILHLIPDEKVTDNVIENFEKVFNDNVFFVYGNPNNRKYCKSVGDHIIFGQEELFVKENINLEVSGIIVHGLNHIFAKLILTVDRKIKIGWFAWGYDIYFLPKLVDRLYASDTYKFLTQRDSKFVLVQKIKKNQLLRGLYYKLVVKREDFYLTYEKAHQRIDYFCSYIKEDYDLFNSVYANKTSFLETGYFSIDQYLAGQEELRVNIEASNILIGNSNSPECNHLDVFSLLKENELNQVKLIVPLNYGTDISYKNEVLRQGKLAFEDDFLPLLDFMDRAKYFELLSSCSTAIFYHYRQQAMGNIIAFLYMGGRVYLSKKNPVFHYFNRLGIRVFDLDTEFERYKNQVLEEDVILHNQTILKRYFSKDVILKQSKELVDQLLNVNR